MNIFILDNNIYKCAEYMVDKHVVKMITEHAQILSTVVRLNGIDAGYRITHQNHPCTIWAGQSLSNWEYLLYLTDAVHEEWKYRYPKAPQVDHKAFSIASTLPCPNIPDIGRTPFAQAMPSQYRTDDAVEAYRAYYVGDKRHLATWKNRPVPYWWK